MGRIRTRTRTRRNDGLSPIARWDVVPYQRFAGTVKLGVVAFHKEEVDRVEFYHGSTLLGIAVSMTLNDRVGVVEYWQNIDFSGFDDGPVTLTFKAYGMDGGMRSVDLLLVNNDGDTVPQLERWVSTSGSDSGAGTSGDPFATIGKAMDYFMANNSNDCGGCIVRLQAGDHQWDRGGYFDEWYCTNEWVTITTAAGGTPTNTRILNTSGERMYLGKARVSGVGIRASNNGTIAGHTENVDDLWVDSCAVTSALDQWTTSNVSVRSGFAHVHWTDTTITGIYYPTGGDARYYVDLMRSCDIQDVGKTAIVEAKLVVNVTVDNCDPAETGAHPNAIAWQQHDWDNWIVYGLRATGLHYSGLSLQRTSNNSTYVTRDIALVNIYLELESPVQDPPSFGMLWVGQCDHMLWWHITIVNNSGESIYNYVLRSTTDTDGYSVIRNASFKGLNWHRIDCNSDDSELAFVNCEWDQGHYVTTPDVDDPFRVNDSNYTDGAADMDANGVPTAAGNLVDRLSSKLVPIDTAGTARDSTPDVGAYEYVA